METMQILITQMGDFKENIFFYLGGPNEKIDNHIKLPYG